MSEDEAYAQGWLCGKAGRDLEFARLNLGGNRLNNYEMGYVDSGNLDAPKRWPAARKPWSAVTGD